MLSGTAPLRSSVHQYPIVDNDASGNDVLERFDHRRERSVVPCALGTVGIPRRRDTHRHDVSTLADVAQRGA